MPQLQWVAFDLFGVVVTDGHLLTNGILPLLPAGTRKADVKPYYDAYTSGQISEATFWQAAGLSPDHPVPRTFLDGFTLDPELASVTQALQQRYRLAILSNFGAEWASHFEQRFGLERIFAPRIYSGAVKCQKPEPAIYQVLLQTIQAEGGQVAFIDDRLENLAVAKQFGMTTIHYVRKPDPHPYQPDCTIRRLGEVLDCLGV